MAEKVTKTIEVKLAKENANMNLAMTPECKERWQKFLADKGYSFLHTSAALMLYMDACKAKEVEVKAVL